MSHYLPSSSDSETRDQAFRRMRDGEVSSDDFTSEKPRHRRVAYIVAIQNGDLTVESAVAMEQKQQFPSDMVLEVLARLAPPNFG